MAIALNKSLVQDLENSEFTDCTFVFNENGLEKTIGSHKILLALVSPVFRAAFFGALPENGVIEIPDISFDIFQKMIWIIYGKTVTLSSSAEASELYYAAQKYSITDPLAVARNYILDNISESTVEEFYKNAMLHNDGEIIARCCSTFFEKTFDTTKLIGFFDSTRPVRHADTFWVGESEDGNVVKASIQKYSDKMKKDSMEDRCGLIVKTLELIRILTSETKKAFELIIPASEAKFHCTLDWIPPTGTMKVLGITHLKRIYIGTCSKGHASVEILKDPTRRCESCLPAHVPFSYKMHGLSPKVRPMDASSQTLRNLKKVYAQLQNLIE